MKLKRYFIGAMAFSGSALLFVFGPTAVQAQSASAAAMLEEVIVTARRREESLQDLPLSVQAITADAMQAQGIYNLEQITEFVPNVVLTEDQRKNDTRFYVRGIGGGFSNPAQVFGVGAYIDGHYLSGSLGAFMSTVDVERVEVLRGPQGTLFGKNTTGGAVSLISAKPGPDFDSYVTLRAADFGETGVRAMVNTAITENVFSGATSQPRNRTVTTSTGVPTNPPAARTSRAWVSRCAGKRGTTGRSTRGSRWQGTGTTTRAVSACRVRISACTIN